ncbi:PAS domain-containing sensor histidine kinase [Rufibacter roseus]|uniref:histidine kinase n=1 Tax=Rufibacter roseus TaxID=1567108 RepID=A0ABW2DPX9_9BACT|nr:PAS domain-containing sensor histidine kinase [Rufibacter roseus]
MEDAITASVEAGEQKRTAPVDLQLFYALVDNSPEPTLLLKPEGTILYANQALCSLVGRSAEFLMKLGRDVLMVPEDPRWLTALEERRLNGEFQGEVLMQHANGSHLLVEVKAKAFTCSGGEVFTSVYIRDMRPHYHSQEQLIKQQQQLQSTLADLQLVQDRSADLICTFDLQGVFLRVNNASQSILGYLPEEMIGKSYLSFIHPDDIAITDDSTAKLQSSASAVITNFKNRYLHKNGSVVHLSWSSSILIEAKKVICIARDKTQLLASERFKEETEMRLQALLSQGADLIAILSAAGEYIFASANSHRILGYSPESFIGKSSYEYIHPEDISGLQKVFEEVLQCHVVKTEPFRFLNSSGEWRWLESTVTNCLEDPNIRGIIANSRDITERKQAELMLQESEQRYKALFHLNPDAVYSLDTKGYYTSANKVTLDLFGLTEEELTKKHLYDYANPETLEKVKAEFKRVLSGESISGESSLIGHNNVYRYFNYTEIPIVVNGEVVGAYGIAKDVTASKEQQLLLEATAKRLHNTLESIKDAFFTIDKDWKFTYVNKEFEQVMRLTRNGLLGQDFREIFPAQDFSESYAQYQQGLSEQRPVHFETLYKPANLWIDVSAYPSEEGVSVYFRGINDRKKTEAELKKLSLVASKTVNSVYITDDMARIEWVNEGFTRVTGYTLEEVVGCRPGDFLAGPATSSDKVNSIREKLALDKPFVQEVQNRNKAGEIYWSKLDVTPIIDKETGGSKKFIVIETEITEQKRAEEERAQLTEELLRRNRHLEQFTYIVSHNLRSPVANVLGLTSLLGTTDSPEMRIALTERLQKTAQNLDAIIRDLNDLLSLRTGAVEMRETVLLPEVIEQALQVLPNDSAKQVTVELNGIKEVGSIRSYLSSIVSNLLTNAVKYQSPDHPLQVRLIAEKSPAEDMLYLSVQDNGLGINLAKEGKNLFGLYKRFHFHVGGRGLGLYLVKTQAEALGGQVHVESEPSIGSIFKVSLPMLKN